jgi:hypothetical protein
MLQYSNTLEVLMLGLGLGLGLGPRNLLKFIHSLLTDKRGRKGHPESRPGT